MIKIVVDGAADMPAGWERDFDIHILPLHVRFGEDVYTQGEGFSNADFYRLVRERNIIPKSSLPSIGQVKEFIERIAQTGDTILSIHISARLSGTFSTVQTAANELADRFQIHVIDSAAGSAAQAFLAREARILDCAGASIPAILQRMEKIRSQWTCLFTLNTLEYAYLSGRINAMQKIFASALQVKPIVVLNDGLLNVVEQVRTRQRALARVVDMVKEQTGAQRLHCAVIHAADPQTAQELMQTLQKCLDLQTSFITDLSVPVAANLGPGAIGIVAYPVEQE